MPDTDRPIDRAARELREVRMMLAGASTPPPPAQKPTPPRAGPIGSLHTPS